LKLAHDKMLNQIRSHSQCTIANNTKAHIPKLVAVIARFNPTLAHQIKKNGLPPESTIPATTGPLLVTFTSCRSMLFILRNIWIAIITRNNPPAKPITILVAADLSIVSNPSIMRIISGNSIMPCPMAISVPANRFRAPIAIAAAVIGPGTITPELTALAYGDYEKTEKITTTIFQLQTQNSLCSLWPNFFVLVSGFGSNAKDSCFSHKNTVLYGDMGIQEPGEINGKRKITIRKC